MIFITILILFIKLIFSFDLTDSLLKNNLSIEREKRAILRRKIYSWREKEIIYTVNCKLDENLIRQALLRISRETCLIFKLTTNPKKALFTYQPGLFYQTNLGRRREIPHKIYVPINKGDIGKVMRETLRALGVDYEHNRYDRDKYIDINWKNVKKEFLKYFQKNFKGSTNTYGTKYDYRSVMHFSEDEYGISGRQVIIAKNEFMQPFMGRSKHLSFYDAKLINEKYCYYPHIFLPLPCQNFGYIHPRIPSICKCPSFTQGNDCQGLITNNHFCTFHNRLFATREKSIVFPRVGGRCTFYISTSYGKKIGIRIEYHNIPIGVPICKDNQHVEIRYKRDLAISGILFCPGHSPQVIVSESNQMVIQSYFPPMQINLVLDFWRISN
uniref:Metalloendopeptidase n=1 Tax=Strongyloides venezuelensis TaxID=75913 RepID=A0A0K0F3L8_STRVS